MKNFVLIVSLLLSAQLNYASQRIEKTMTMPSQLALAGGIIATGVGTVMVLDAAHTFITNPYRNYEAQKQMIDGFVITLVGGVSITYSAMQQLNRASVISGYQNYEDKDLELDE